MKQSGNKSETKSVLFIIGNGFDLGLNMKTSYEDVYNKYIVTPSKSIVISKFKNELSKRKPYDKWSDFEMGMAEYAETLELEDELIECVWDFKEFMVECLQEEYNNINKLIQDAGYSKFLIEEFHRSLDSFYNGFIPNVQNQIKNAINGNFPEYNFITFNYTKTLESFLSIIYKHQMIYMEPPLHIHGSLDNDVVLGIDNLEQIKKAKYQLSKKGKRAFVKTFFNEQYDYNRVLRAKELISKSSVICTYGFSMGESDKTWIDLMKNWLIEDSNHHLVVYQYDETKYKRHRFDEIMNVEDEKKEILLKRFEIDDESILEQIHIPISYDIFNFEFKKIVTPTTPGSLINHYA